MWQLEQEIFKEMREDGSKLKSTTQIKHLLCVEHSERYYTK